MYGGHCDISCSGESDPHPESVIFVSFLHLVNFVGFVCFYFQYLRQEIAMWSQLAWNSLKLPCLHLHP